MPLKDGSAVMGGGVGGLLPQEEMEVGRHILESKGGGNAR
jgi:hypothetical protein